jgi:P2 family phage major capsid protein
VQQRLETKIQQSSEFLKLINIIPVNEMMGRKSAWASLAPLPAAPTPMPTRAPQKESAVDETATCAQTNYDTHIKYNTLDSWAKFADFAARVSAVRLQRCALDRIMIGFNAPARPPPPTSPQTPAAGCEQGLAAGSARQRPQRAGQRQTAGKVVVGGAGADYKSLDGLVFDAVQNLLEPWHSQAGDLVAITGRNLLNDKLFPLVNDPKAPTETLAADIVRSQRRWAACRQSPCLSSRTAP